MNKVQIKNQLYRILCPASCSCSCSCSCSEATTTTTTTTTGRAHKREQRFMASYGLHT